MFKMKTKILSLVFILTAVLTSSAQCAMCRAVLENEDGQKAAKGINDGIVYLMSIPYILVFGLGFFIYWKFFRTKKQ